MEIAAAMKRFYKEATASADEAGWRVLLDGRGVKSQGARAQIVPTAALANVLAAEWSGQGEEIDPAQFVMRDLADYAIDGIAADRAAVLADLLRYAETDTLCYRAEPDEPSHDRQLELWEPLLLAAEARWQVQFERIAGIIHRPQPALTLDRLQAVLAPKDDFTLAALVTLTTLSASLVIGLSALEPDADLALLWRASELEADWQVEQWGKDDEAELRAVRRYATFAAAARFAKLARS
jgi:chaperone required for assembly of F1-ATPase